MQSRRDYEEKLLEEIKDKLMAANRGILVWGTTVRLAENDYRVLLMDDNGKLMASS